MQKEVPREQRSIFAPGSGRWASYEGQEDFEALAAQSVFGEVFALWLRAHYIPVQRQLLPPVGGYRAIRRACLGSGPLEQRDNLIL